MGRLDRTVNMISVYHVNIIGLLGSIIFLLPSCGAINAVNDRPIIGVMAQDVPISLQPYANGSIGYIASSYIKFVETGGARAAPILMGQSAKYYRSLFKRINGVLLPGGSANVSLNASYYSRASEAMYNLAIVANKEGDYFPIWGTCLGMEMLSVLSAGANLLSYCEASGVALNITPTAAFNTSRLYSDVPTDIYDFLTRYNSTANYHHMCITDKEVDNSSLKDMFVPLSVSFDNNGLEFISSYEDKSFPFFGVQWHPEKPMFEWSRQTPSTPHDVPAIRAGQYYSNFMVQQARKSNHSFRSDEEEQSALIYNYQTFNTAKVAGYYDEVYFF